MSGFYINKFQKEEVELFEWPSYISPPPPQNQTDKLKNGIATESGKLRNFITKTANEKQGAIIEESCQKVAVVEGRLRAYQDYLRKQQDLMDSVRALLKEPDDGAFQKVFEYI